MKKKKAYFLACLIFISMVFSGCLIAWDPAIPYSGEHMDLETTAIYSIPGVNSDLDDQIIVLEQDAYGRVLFAACLPNSIMIKDSFEECILAVMIMQSSDESSAYFYEEKNYVFKIVSEPIDLHSEIIGDYFSDETVHALKQQNDWDCAYPSEDINLLEVSISAEKGNDLDKNSEKIVSEKIGSNFRYAFFREDAARKQAYFILNILGEYASYTQEWYLVIFDSDGNLADDNSSILKLPYDSTENLPDIVEAFLSENDWNDKTTPP